VGWITVEIIVLVGRADCIKVIGEGDVCCGASDIWFFLERVVPA
jgi:hypothetical protein